MIYAVCVIRSTYSLPNQMYFASGASFCILNAMQNDAPEAKYQAMMNSDKTQLQEHIDQLNESCETYSMKISTSKTEVMTVSKRPDKLDININGTQLKQTNEFKYLGSMFTENGKLDREIETRCQKANAVSYQLAPLLKHPSISTSTKHSCANRAISSSLA